MNHRQWMDAYAAAKTRFGLTAKMRDALDASPLYSTILDHAHQADWWTVQRLLNVVMEDANLQPVATPDLIDAGPQYHDVCGHFHTLDGSCPDTPCGSYLCCIN